MHRERIAPLFCMMTELLGAESRRSARLAGMHETRWHSLPHVIGRQQLLAVAGLAAVHLPLQRAVAADRKARTALTVDEWLAIPVWPTWGGGRVIPMSFDPSLADPFLLLAHHKHSFSPGDPLRGPFKAVGGALGLPYVGDEGFKMHPHRGIDILTYVLDGSDGFRHRDSLGGACVYRGGAAQFMRSGRTAAWPKCPRSHCPKCHSPLQKGRQLAHGGPLRPIRAPSLPRIAAAVALWCQPKMPPIPQPLPL